MFALVLNNQVVDISQNQFPVNSNMQWIECNDSVQLGWFYINGQFKITQKSDEEFLIDTKNNKIQQIKDANTAANITPITNIEADLLDSSGQSTGQKSFFTFYTNRHPINPASDPGIILTSIIISKQNTSYSTKEPITGQSILVSITPTLAMSLASLIATKNQNNYKLKDQYIAQVNAMTSIEEVNSFNPIFE